MAQIELEFVPREEEKRLSVYGQEWPGVSVSWADAVRKAHGVVEPSLVGPMGKAAAGAVMQYTINQILKVVYYKSDNHIIYTINQALM